MSNIERLKNTMAKKTGDLEDFRGTTGSVARQSAFRLGRGHLHFRHDDIDAPLSPHPDRALYTFLLLVFFVAALELWGGWKLISLLLSSV